MKYFLLLFSGAAFLFLSCKNTPAATGKLVAFGQLPADFQAFYEKFHADSAYQIAHISWPLRGETSVVTDSTHTGRRLAAWQPETWRLQHAVDFRSGEFKGEWELTGNEFIVERIRYAAANFGLERHFFKRDDGEWELIYYADMQEGG